MNGNSDPCKEAACWCVPTEFVRPRFFYGQRLGVVDFTDWLWYHAGKQRFHNLLCHGVGVLCGLRAELYLPYGEAGTTLLRVTRGAAVDACGREVVVGYDQCIDVAEWFRENRAQLDEWIAAGDHRLCVGLRYRECPSDPAPAPRDPCGCDAGGCEYARVREGFDLDLFTPDVLPAVTTDFACGAYHTFLETLAATPGRAVDACAALRELLHGLTPAECPPPSDGGWLWLACFAVTLDEERQEVTAISEPDNAIAQRLELLSTAALQEILLGVARDVGLDRAGPRISGIELNPRGGFWLNVALYNEPSRSEPSALVPATLNADCFHLRRFTYRDIHTSAGWHPLALARVQYDSAGTRVGIQLSDPLEEGRYRLTVISPPESPIVDTEMRPLLPLTYSCNFQVRTENDGLVLGLLS